MRKKVLAAALVGVGLPALALAAQPILVRFEGRTVPVHETVRMIRSSAGPVRVRTWSWRGPNGAAIVQVSESRGAAPAVPAWALEQMRAMQAQMRQMQLIQAALQQPMLMPSFPMQVLFGQPLFAPMSGLQLPVELHILEPVIPLRIEPLPVRVITIVPAPSAPAAHRAPARHSGLLT
jgi:hypothetical protein